MRMIGPPATATTTNPSSDGMVAKVVAPELQPLDVAYDGRFLGGRRLYRAAFELGLRAEPATFDDLNPHPHPFP
jgi:ribosomal protein S12 methylthiotransferase accessory factor